MKNIPVKLILIYSWLIVSFLYIGYDVYNRVLSSVYLQRQNDTIKAVIKQASNTQCQPFNIYEWNNKVDLINVSCLQKSSNVNSEIKK